MKIMKMLQTSKAKRMVGFAFMALVMLLNAYNPFAAPDTGNPDIDAMLTEMETGFTTAKAAFLYLAIASVAITLVVVVFFWLRGKFKQAVSGA